MDLADFIEAKRGLEQDLAVLIGARIRQFQSATGFSPRNVDVSMVDTSCLGDARSNYVVRRVNIDVPVE